MRFRLSLLMFVQWAVVGAFHPLFTLRLQELEFTAWEIGYVSSAQAIAAMIAPIIVGQIADRWFAAERCLLVCSALAAVLLLILARLTQPVPTFLAALGLWIVLNPVSTLVATISFTHLAAPDREFGPVRMWGTVGWMVMGWSMGYWFSNPVWLTGWLASYRTPEAPTELADSFRLASLLACILALYALTLPHTPPRRGAGARFAPLAALVLFKRRSFVVFWVAAFGVYTVLPFIAQLTPLLLKQLGVSRTWISPMLSLSQTMEVVALAVLPMLVENLGRRRTMLLGLSAWCLQLGLLTIGQPVALVAGALPLNGVGICCFLVLGQVFVNQQAEGDFRASAQALFSCTAGVGMLVGNLLAGWIRRTMDDAFAPTLGVAAGIALVLVVIFYVGFPREQPCGDV